MACRCTILQYMPYMAACWLTSWDPRILRPRSGGGNCATPGGLQATKPDGCRTPNINVTVYPACKLQYTCRQSSQMVILRDLKDFRISNVHVAKDMPLSLVALKGPADLKSSPTENNISKRTAEETLSQNYRLGTNRVTRNLTLALWRHILTPNWSSFVVGVRITSFFKGNPFVNY